MKNIELLFEYNDKLGVTPKLIKNQFIYKSSADVLDGVEIKKLLFFLNTLNKTYSKIICPIVLDFRSVNTIKDKLTYVILECICYYLIVCKKQCIILKIFNIKNNIFTEGIRSSPLLLINNARSKKKRMKFIDKFEFDIYGTHFRKIIKGDNKENTNYLGTTMNDIKLFLKNFKIDETCCDEISKTVIELIGNAVEHTKSDCLIDIDVADNYMKKGCENENFYGINIVVINFSKQLLGDALKNKINKIDLSKQERYKYVVEAYAKHKEHFNSNYSEEDFYNIASFQYKISGDVRKIVTGGKGLTELINSLETRSDMHACYMLSGTRVIFFIHDCLQFNDEKWIGFNEKKDFLNQIPDMNCIGSSKVFIPGTSFNLNFVMRKEDDYYEYK